MKSKSVKRLILLLLICVFLISSVLSGCAGISQKAGTAKENSGSGTADDASKGTNDNQDTEKNYEPLTIDIFNNAANYQGEQTGWFGQIVKEKFNLTLNILAPQISSDALYQTRAAAGDLGDIVIIDNSQLEECIPAGLITDMTDIIRDYPNLMEHYDQFEYFNSSFEKANPEGRIYGLPTYTAGTSPTTYSEELAYSSPLLPWDYYSEMERPLIDDLNGLLDVLQQMLNAHPTNTAGKKTVAITLWKDWDTWSMENVRWLCNWYGYEQPEGTGSVLLNEEGDIVPFTDDNSMYRKILKFYYDANQRGLVDPDSAAQDWNSVADKLTNKQVLLLWYSWERGFYNTIARGENKDGHVMVPIGDMNIIQTGDAYYGKGRVWALGSKAKDPDRAMEFMDWYASPEGIRYHCAGIEGFNYKILEDGRFEYTETGKTAFQNNTPVSAEYGGGGYKDGQSAINTMIMSDFCYDPMSGEFYNPNYWSTTLEMNKTALNNEWSDIYQAKNPMDYLLKNNMIDVVPNINTSLGSDSSDIKNKRSQCSELLKNTSWKMVFAQDENEFNQLWEKMQNDLEGLGWKDVVDVDTARCEKIAGLRAKAVGK